MANDDERPKLTFAERDKLRRDRAKGYDDRPRGPGAELRQEKRRRDALTQADALFASDAGGPEGDRFGKAMRDAHGTPGLADACRAYREGVGAMPADPELLALFLDTREATLVVDGLDALLELQGVGRLAIAGSLKSRLRVLAQDFDADVADRAEELLEG